MALLPTQMMLTLLNNGASMEDDIQDKLVKAYLEYFKAHEWWVRKRSHRSYYETQKWLREIRKLAKAKQEENTDYFYNVKKAKKDDLED